MDDIKKNEEKKECECGCGHHDHDHHDHDHHECGSNISCGCGHDHGHSHGHEEEEGNGDLIKLIAGGILYLAVLAVDKLGIIKGDYAKYILLGMYLVPYLIIGLETIVGAVKNIAHGEFFDEEFLMTIATIGALVVGEYPEAVAVMLLSGIGEMFEDFAVEKSRDSIAAMMDIAPDHANLLTDDGVKEVDPDEVSIGDIIVVKPGERVPLDGVITEGKSMLNTSALTGESVPRSAGVGDEIFSGCVNESGMLKVKVNKVYDDSTVARVLKLVEESEERKARSEGFVTKFARVYTPVVVFVALFIAIALPLILHQDFMTWIYRACNFLVISCPCALVISVPLAFFTGIGSASRYGILIKGSNFIEAASKVKTMVFDKTGTLTKGEFSVTLVSPVKGTKEELLEMAAAAEKYSTHPIAAAIRAAHGSDIEESRIADVNEISGHGISVKFDGNEILAGNARLMAKYGVGIVETDAAEAVGTTVYVAKNGEFMGTVIISDVIKEEAAEAIADLKRAGARCVMLTGDKKEVAEHVAETIGIDEMHAELLPSDKVSEFEKLLSGSNGKVAFTGDGINDAPVIARADVGIAMGSMGSDAAIEAADIVLMDDDVKKLAKAVAVSKKTMRIVTENIAFSLGIKFLIMVLSVIGLGTMWMAVFADVGVSIIAISNSLRLLKKNI